MRGLVSRGVKSTKAKGATSRRRAIRGNHFVSLEPGGNDDIPSLFPEAANPQPGFHDKDELENRLPSLVCCGQLTLRKAHGFIKVNWIAACADTCGRQANLLNQSAVSPSRIEPPARRWPPSS